MSREVLGIELNFDREVAKHAANLTRNLVSVIYDEPIVQPTKANYIRWIDYAFNGLFKVISASLMNYTCLPKNQEHH